jgi:hypothetical protein
MISRSRARAQLKLGQYAKLADQHAFFIWQTAPELR